MAMPAVEGVVGGEPVGAAGGGGVAALTVALANEPADSLVDVSTAVTCNTS